MRYKLFCSDLSRFCVSDSLCVQAEPNVYFRGSVIAYQVNRNWQKDTIQHNFLNKISYCEWRTSSPVPKLYKHDQSQKHILNPSNYNKSAKMDILPWSIALKSSAIKHQMDFLFLVSPKSHDKHSFSSSGRPLNQPISVQRETDSHKVLYLQPTIICNVDSSMYRLIHI